MPSLVFGQMYSLSVYASDGAKPYLINVSPSGKFSNGLMTFAKGTKVTLTASSNTLFSFDQWDNGDTKQERVITINEDTNVIAYYSSKNYIAGWDFYEYGNKDRVADYYSTSNSKEATLSLWLENGSSTQWMLNSASSTNTWFGKHAAVIWKGKNSAGSYYFQLNFNASEFENIHISLSMLGVYTYYHTQDIFYSIDDTTFNKLESIHFEEDSTWYNGVFKLPNDANRSENVSIRIRADKTSVLTTNGNLGTSIADIYLFADPFNDGKAPVLISTSPENKSTNEFIEGTIKLTFDEKVQLAKGTKADFNWGFLTEVKVTGKSIEFPYSQLAYNAENLFRLPANSLSDLSGNIIDQPIEISFKTIDRLPVTKKKFDFIVGVDGDFKAALDAAKGGASSGKRFYIFFPNGEYNIGELTGDGNQMTTISIPNVSYIGESADGVILYNKAINESISTTATIYFSSASSNIYMQDITLLNKMDYRSGSLLGRAAALMDKGNKNIYKNVKLLSNQDTYYSGGDRTYWETSEIHGTTDFICGGGDIFFNKCLIYLEEKSGPVITAPATTGKWGYVFMDCTIDGFPVTNNAYNLGRPWSNSPKSVFINTIMKKLPAEAAWGNPMNVVPAVFAEYNSMTAGRTPVDLSKRRTTYTKNETTVTLDPVLSDDEAAQYTLKNVLSGTDNWQPQVFTHQIELANLVLNNNILKWDDNDYVLCWALFKNGKFDSFTIENEYTVPENTPAGTIFSVRGANEMGGLGEESRFNYPTAVQQINDSKEIEKTEYYTITGQRIQAPSMGVNIIITRYKDGTYGVSKVINVNK